MTTTLRFALALLALAACDLSVDTSASGAASTGGDELTDTGATHGASTGDAEDASGANSSTGDTGGTESSTDADTSGTDSTTGGAEICLGFGESCIPGLPCAEGMTCRMHQEAGRPVCVTPCGDDLACDELPAACDDSPLAACNAVDAQCYPRLCEVNDDCDGAVCREGACYAE